MAALKEAPLSAAIAWSPLGGPYLAAGTAAGGIDASFSSASVVEVSGAGGEGRGARGGSDGERPRAGMRPSDLPSLWAGGARAR